MRLFVEIGHTQNPKKAEAPKARERTSWTLTSTLELRGSEGSSAGHFSLGVVTVKSLMVEAELAFASTKVGIYICAVSDSNLSTFTAGAPEPRNSDAKNYLGIDDAGLLHVTVLCELECTRL